MAIFQIKRIESKSSEAPEVVKVEDTQSTEAYQGEMKKAKEVTGEVPVTEDSVDTKEERKPFSLDNEEVKKDVVVKVNGPLSHVFTDALNKILATESMVAVPMTQEQIDALLEEKAYNEVVQVNVSAFDASDIKNDDVVELSRDISIHPDQEYVLAMETSVKMKMNTTAGMAAKIFKDKASPCFKIDRAAETLVAILKTKM